MSNSFQLSIQDYGALGKAGAFILDGPTGNFDIPLTISPSTRNIVFVIHNYASASSPNIQVSFAREDMIFVPIIQAQPQSVPGNVTVCCYQLDNIQWYSETSDGTNPPTVSQLAGVPTMVRFESVQGTPPELIDTMSLTIFFQ